MRRIGRNTINRIDIKSISNRISVYIIFSTNLLSSRIMDIVLDNEIKYSNI